MNTKKLNDEIDSLRKRVIAETRRHSGRRKEQLADVVQKLEVARGAQSPLQQIRFGSYGLFALGALFAGYFVMLGTRTIGWIALGFERESA
jgi:hypothetical protein